MFQIKFFKLIFILVIHKLFFFAAYPPQGYDYYGGAAYPGYEADYYGSYGYAGYGNIW